jgi:radical SAM protein with 4Fe4S-binding SPASM domain
MHHLSDQLVNHSRMASTTVPRFKRVNIEISNICNLKCSFCPAGEAEANVMDVARFESVIGQVAPMTEEVVLHLLGEPLGHPQFSRILDSCEAAKVPVNIVTNGVLMTGDRPAQLLRPVVRQVSFSLHSFEDNFKDSDPRVYLRRIRRFVDEAVRQRPDLYINLRLWDINGVAHDQTGRNASMRALLAQTFDFTWDDVRVDLRRRKNWRIPGLGPRSRIYLHFDSRFEWPDMSQPVRAEKGFCHGLSGHFGIHANGAVVPCCLDHKAEINLGNVFANPVTEILAGPRATAIREGFARGDLVEDLCRRCTFITRFG